MKRCVKGFAVVLAVGLLGLGALFVPIGYAAVFINPHTGANTDIAESIYLRELPPALTDPASLRVMTFNVQNLLIIGRNRAARMRAIADKLGELDPDIVGFQEVFVGRERRLLIDKLREKTRLDHFTYYESGTVGSGLLTASAYPIREAFFHRYTASNRWYHLWEGDWWAGKGIGVARIELPGGMLDFFNTHAQASYGRAANKQARALQLVEAAEFMGQVRLATAPALAVGDFNCRPGDAPYDKLVADAGLQLLMDEKHRIDNIFACTSPHYRFTREEFLVIHDHAGLRLSDHDGYLSAVRIDPRV
ncbi:MAG: endonuclease/exonuclease/phosphatase family protein [Candidatus Hydrogenedentota bacterium]